MFETLVEIVKSSSSSPSSSPSEVSITLLKKTAPFVRFGLQSENKSSKQEFTLDENQNIIPVSRGKGQGVKRKLSSRESIKIDNDSKSSISKLPPKRLISTSKNRVEVDVYFMDWVRKKMGIANNEPEVVVNQAEKQEPSRSSSLESTKKAEKKDCKPDPNNNEEENEDCEPDSDNKEKQKEKKGPFKYLRRGEGRRASTACRSRSQSREEEKDDTTDTKKKGKMKKGTANTKDSTTTTAPTTATETAKSKDPKKSSEEQDCRRCGPCGGKGQLSGAPPAYLDYGMGGAANCAGEAWKGKRKTDPVMDRLKNVDVVEEMTYLVPMPNCGGQGDACDSMEGAEEDDDDCDYYAVCESCGEMEPIPEELKKELKSRKKKKKVDNTPVTYSRRQRFNFKSKGDMCDEEDGPPYPYEGLQCPGAGCRCNCCVAGLRRNPECECPCCQTMGVARKCSSFDEMPVGKNPVIRRILCPEEFCAKRRKECIKRMPDVSGMYKFDRCEQMFERQVPRTPTPIVVEVEEPEPLTKEQLLQLGREIQDKKRLGIGVDAYCRPKEQNPVYLPPIYGQCNPPQCLPCMPNYCCPPPCGEQEKPGTGSQYGYGSGYYSDYGKSRRSRTPTSTKSDARRRPAKTEVRRDQENKTKISGGPGTTTTPQVTDPTVTDPTLVSSTPKRSTSSESLPTE